MASVPKNNGVDNSSMMPTMATQTQQQQQQNYPYAAYPPTMISNRYPSTQLSSLRSSLKQPPQTSHERHRISSAPSSLLVASGSGTNLSSAGAVSVATTSAEEGKREHQQHQQPWKQAAAYARLRMVSWDTLACINCAEDGSRDPYYYAHNNDDDDGVVTTTPIRANRTRSGSSSAATTSRKMGPLLLELRRLELMENNHNNHNKQSDKNRNIRFDAGDDDDVGRDNQDDEQDPNDVSCSFVRTVTLCQSRGNPSLGMSITSTCLDIQTDVDPTVMQNAATNNNNNNNNQQFPHCATGLSTGALCVHSFLQHRSNNSNNSSSSNSSNHQLTDEEEEPASGDGYQLDSYCYYQDAPQASIEYYYTPRTHRAATAVAWRPSNQHHVAVGLTGVGSGNDRQYHHHHSNPGSVGVAGVGMGAGASISSRSVGSMPGLGIASAHQTGAGGGGGGSNRNGPAGDRDYCCFIWDVEHQQPSPQPSASSATIAATAGSNRHYRTKNTPLHKLSHLTGVASLGWILADSSSGSSSTLLVGGQQRHLQLCDLRTASNSNSTAPVTVYAHNFGVHGIAVDPARSWQFATFCRAVGEPVKLWDARRMDAGAMSEIKIGAASSSSSTAIHNNNKEFSHSLSSLSRSAAAVAVSAVKWSPVDAGHLSILVGDSSLHTYDTSAAGLRPVHVGTLHHHRQPLLDFIYYPYLSSSLSSNFKLERSIPRESSSHLKKHDAKKKQVLEELFPKRILVIRATDQTVGDVPAHRLAPLAISHRTGQVVHALGRTLFLTSPSSASLGDGKDEDQDQDISMVMMRRARCHQVAKYSMDTIANIELLTQEHENSGQHVVSASTTVALSLSTARDQLIQLWKWIQRTEFLCEEAVTAVLAGTIPDDSSNMMAIASPHGGEPSLAAVETVWPAKSLLDAGVLRLLQMDDGKAETNGFSESLCCATYDSEGRRAALTSCGWAGRFDLESVMDECEVGGEFERSAALAVWHEDIGAAVDALQRGSSLIQSQLGSNSAKKHFKAHFSAKYTETLDLVALSIAGYRGSDAQSSATHVWRKACANLLQRPELANASSGSSGVGYLRHILRFLMTIGIDNSHKDVLNDAALCLCDRVAFACRFLMRDDLHQFLYKCINECETTGNVEGLTITGIEMKGISILQSYVDISADAQSAALITSRVVFPGEWTTERRAAAEWLHAYRSLLNRWQMWQSRAMFDVDRAELLRKVKMRLAEMAIPGASKHGGARRLPPARRTAGVRSPDPDVQASVPAQLDARCNYCSAPLGLRKQDSQPNQWLSKMKNVLSCCPQCRKPLPRCAICMLPLGALNPFTELMKRGSAPTSGDGSNLSSLANLPFAEWFTWCMRCKHGGHAHHLVGWFSKHEVCPVSGCDCQCQFDGINKLRRPVLLAHSSSSDIKEQVSDPHEEDTERR